MKADEQKPRIANVVRPAGSRADCACPSLRHYHFGDAGLELPLRTATIPCRESELCCEPRKACAHPPSRDRRIRPLSSITFGCRVAFRRIEASNLPSNENSAGISEIRRRVDRLYL